MEHVVYDNDVRSGRPSRSTTRTSNRIRKKTPPRYSPSRKSPSRRSPGRRPLSATRRSIKPNTRLARVSIPRIDISIDKPNNKVQNEVLSSEDTFVDSLPLSTRLKGTEPTLRRSVRTRNSSVPKTELNDNLFVLPRKSDRAVSLPVEKKNDLLQFAYNTKERGYSVQRDQDLTKIVDCEKITKVDPVAEEKLKSEIHLVNEPQEWGGKCGAFILIFVLPLCVILPQFFCTKTHCKFELFKISTDFNAYINASAFFAYAGFLIILSSFVVIPIGKCVDGQQSKIGTLQYRMNGLLCVTVILLIYCVFIHQNIVTSDFILENSVQLCISGWILGTMLSIILYIKGGKEAVSKLNIHACTNSSIYNFWQGREINPRIGMMDFKIILLRASTIGMIIINVTILIKAFEDTKGKDLSIEHFNSAVFLAAALQIFYALDALIFESVTLTSFEIMYEGTGYMLCIAHLLYPFLPTLVTRFMLYEKAQLNQFSGIFILSYISGYILYRMSNSQKDKFRKNPLSPALTHLNTIPTPRGKKIIMSGLWGYVRHPNYLGDILMQWSVPCISLTTNILPYYAAFCCTIALMYRAIRDNTRCKIRYGTAWEEYCTRVKYMILNHLF